MMELTDEQKLKVGDQWYYRGNRSPAWFARNTMTDGSMGGLADKVNVECWAFLEAIAELQAKANRDPILARLDLIGELTSPEYISRLRGVMGEVDITVDKGGVRFGKWYWVSHEAITGCCAELIPTKHRQYWEWALANINRPDASPVAGEVK